MDESGPMEQDPPCVCHLAPCRTIRALGAFRTFRTIRTFRPLRAVGPLRTLGTIPPLRAIRPIRPIAPFVSLGAVRAVRPLGAGWSLYLHGRPLVGNLAEHGSHVARGDRARGQQG
jgi:hypothetical protein